MTGLKINRDKTKVMTIYGRNDNPIITGEPLEEADSFTYLGRVIDKRGGTEADVTARVGKA